MLRAPALLLVLLTVAGCDTAGPEAPPEADARFVGVWEGDTVELATVVSATAQRGAGFELPARGAITVRGAVEAEYTYVRQLSAEHGQAAAADRRRGQLWLHDGYDTTLYVAEAGGSTRLRFSGLAFSIDEAAGTLTVPEQTVATTLGAVTVGGALTVQGYDVPAGVATALPPRPSRDIEYVLTLAADGTFVREYPWGGLRVEGTWTSSGDAVTLTPATGEPATFTLDGGALFGPGTTTEPTDPTPFATTRGLAPGSLTSATITTTSRLVRAD